MLDKIYLEITNVCNLDCTFCHKTARAKKLMSAQANLDTVRGPLNVRWVKRYGGVHLYVDLPAGVTANVVFGGKQTTLTAGSHHLEYPEA